MSIVLSFFMMFVQCFQSGAMWLSADELLEPDNMRVTVEISLVSCIQAEILVISNLFPVSAAICDLPLALTRTVIALFQSW